MGQKLFGMYVWFLVLGVSSAKATLVLVESQHWTFVVTGFCSVLFCSISFVYALRWGLLLIKISRDSRKS